MSFFRILFLLFLTIPLIEIYLLIQVGEVIGALSTVFLVVATAVLGVWLLRWQGLMTMTKVQTTLARGELPALPMIEGVTLLIAGALLLTPGFFTDAIGFTLLVPPLRQKLAQALLRQGMFSAGAGFSQGGFYQHESRQSGEGHSGPRVIDGECEHRDEK
ncbi:MAG: FxsA family protein [Gammaproteobacteria bacterium]|nr:FxsA family protein [Gammaproteobacteria bacterium]